MGNISFQITGISPFTDLPFATVGNDFSLPTKTLEPTQLTQYRKIVMDIGNKLKLYGWKGLFGIDVIISIKTGRVYLLEVNGRQPASVTFESNLQMENRKKKISGLSTFEAHLMGLFGLPLKGESIIPLRGGAQIIQRVTQKRTSCDRKIEEKLAELPVSFVVYQNIAKNSELIRIQNMRGLMDEPDIFNAIGKKIVAILS